MENYNALFDNWSLTYDETVYDHNNEYSEVFENYQGILKKISGILENKKDGLILEIGSGTGNLLKQLCEDGFKVKGVEPSAGMRKVSMNKLPLIDIRDGHFMNIPFGEKFDAIVTSYALHHLNLREKRQALIYLDGFVKSSGRIIIADTMFECERYKKQLHASVRDNGLLNLLEDLNTEHYEYISDLTEIFDYLGYSYDVIKMNKYVWILSALKGGN